MEIPWYVCSMCGKILLLIKSPLNAISSFVLKPVNCGRVTCARANYIEVNSIGDHSLLISCSATNQ